MFLIVMDWVMKRTVGHGESGIRWKFTTKLDDLDFADDVALLTTVHHKRADPGKKQTVILQEKAGRVGLKIDGKKNKVMRINAKNHDKIKVEGQDIENVDGFIST